MEVSIKHFSELSRDELFDIYKLRVSVFVVEQQCPYQEVDDGDRSAYHVFMKDEEGIQAYLRILPAGVSFDQVSLGRVIAVKRRRGLGTRIVLEGIKAARELLDAREIKIEAQVYAKELYEKIGFVQTSEEFLEDGIPHVEMVWKPGER